MDSDFYGIFIVIWRGGTNDLFGQFDNSFMTEPNLTEIPHNVLDEYGTFLISFNLYGNFKIMSY